VESTLTNTASGRADCDRGRLKWAAKEK
jgi:hypothetical protein